MVSTPYSASLRWFHVNLLHLERDSIAVLSWREIYSLEAGELMASLCESSPDLSLWLWPVTRIYSHQLAQCHWSSPPTASQRAPGEEAHSSLWCWAASTNEAFPEWSSCLLKGIRKGSQQTRRKSRGRDALWVDHLRRGNWVRGESWSSGQGEFLKLKV